MTVERAWLCGLLGLASAVLAGLGAGCGGSVCGEYCEASITCVGEVTCDPADRVGAVDACNDACGAGFEVVSTAEEHLVRDCIRCLSPKLQDSCVLGEAYTQCEKECGEDPSTAAALTKWQTASLQVYEKSGLVCTNGRPFASPVACSVMQSSEGTEGTEETCSISCGMEALVAVDCAGPQGADLTCACTAGKQTGKSFAASCNDLGVDANRIWDECNL